MKNLKYSKYIIITLIIIFICCLNQTISKYYNSYDLQLYGYIAKPIFEIDYSELVEITSKEEIGKYNFSVKNYKDSKISDICFLYSIEVIPEQPNLDFVLYRDGQKENLTNNKTSIIKMDNNQEICHKYLIEIRYNGEEDAKDINQKVKIEVHSEQLKYT